jgi:CHAD domain-containing protein
MSMTRHQFRIPNEQLLSHLEEQLLKKFSLQASPLQHWKLTYYDTFDGRVYAQDRVLRLEQNTEDSEDRWLTLLSLDGTQIIHRGRAPELPSIIRELPETPLRTLLADRLHPRALLPRLTLDVKHQPWIWVNKDQKTTLRMVAEASHFQVAEEESTPPIDLRLYVIPVKGYPKPLKQALEFCRHKLFLPDVVEELFVAAHSKQPGGTLRYSAKPKVTLKPQHRTDQSLRAILRASTEIMDQNLAGTLADHDPEFLHDYRVSCRRARSALNLLRGAFPKQRIAAFREDFSWLSDMTGPTRDLDVYLLQFNSYQAQLPAEQRASLEPFRALLQSEQTKEQQKLAEALQSERYQDFRKRWDEFLDEKEESSTAMGAQAVWQSATEQLWQSYRKCVQQGQAIEDDSPDEALHELRKTCKKFRYLLEFFSSLFPSKELQSVVKTLKVLQENLGEFNDCSVQQESLAHYSKMLAEQPQTPVDTLLAMGMLVGELHQRKHQSRHEFRERFHEFASAKYRQKCQQLFKNNTVEGNAS